MLRLSFRAKTALSLTLVGALILLGVSWRSLAVMHAEQEAALVVRAQSVTELFAVTAKDSVVASDLAALQALTQSIVALPGIDYARVRDADGAVLATSGNAPPAAEIIAQNLDVDETRDGVLDRSSDIGNGASLFGRVEIGIPVDQIYDALRDGTQSMAISSLIALLLIALFGYLFADLLSRPLAVLRDGASRLAEGELGLTLPVKGHDDIAATAIAFNRMSERLRELMQDQTFQHEITETIRNAQADFIGAASDRSAFVNILAQILRLTQSEVGFIGCMPENVSGPPTLHTLAATPHADSAVIFSAHSDILQATSNEETAVRESPTTTPLTSDWHVLYIPLSSGSTHIGVIALAKRGTPYAEDTIPRLRLLWSALAALIHARRSEIQRRHVERELAASAQGTRALLDHVIDGILSINTKGAIVECNPATEKLFGYSRDELVGKNIKYLMPEPIRHQHDDYLTKYLETGIAAIIGIGRDVTAQRKDGSLFPMELGIGVVRDENGPSLYIGVVRDISARKETEDALLRARDLAIWTAEAKSHFLATISHELRTPMHGLMGMLTLLEKTPLTDQQKRFAETAQRSGQNLLDIINDVLDLSKLEGGRVELANQPFSLPTLVAEINATFSKKCLAKRLTFLCNVELNVPEKLCGDEKKFRQLLVNLVGNAIKFTEFGSVQTRYSIDETHADNVLLRVEIEDTGIGISPASAAKLFAPFQQADNTTTRRYGGTGLGLAICKQLAEAMGGEIGLRSTPGSGSLFWFTIRLGYGAAVASDNTQISPTYAPNGSPRPLRGRILLAEDDPVSQEVALTMLRGIGITVDLVTTGREAIELCQTNNYDLVLMDCQMSEFDGFEATRLIRSYEAIEEKPRLPVIALTANAMPGDKEQCLAAGMDDHLAKPFSEEELRAKIAPFLTAEPQQALLEPSTQAMPEAADTERLQGLRKMLGARFDELVDKFETNAHIIMDRMQAATDTANTEELMRAAHSLKGSSGTIGATVIFRVSSELEEAARLGPVADAAAIVAQLRAEYARFHDAVALIKHA